MKKGIILIIGLTTLLNASWFNLGFSSNETNGKWSEKKQLEVLRTIKVGETIKLRKDENITFEYYKKCEKCNITVTSFCKTNVFK